MRWLLLCVGVLGCGSEATEMPDLTAPPADLSAPLCNPELGRMYFVSSLRIVPTGEGFDLTGDGMIDNRMGVAAAFANNDLAD